MESQKQPQRHPSVTIAIPASLVANTPHLREKTYKIGSVGRAAAIFRIDTIIIYQDKPTAKANDAELIASILTYMETPQYLRKALFPFKPTLRYVGILPPLRTYHHPLNKRIEALKPGQLRVGIVIKSNSNQSYVDIGVNHPVILNEPNLAVNKRVTVKILTSLKNALKVCLVDSEEIDIYWGYDARVSNLTLGTILNKESFDLVVLTSRHGKPLTKTDEVLRDKWKAANQVLIAFGSPQEGLKTILEKDGFDIDQVNTLLINTIPRQGTATIRTEEAVYTTLAVMNILVKENNSDGS
jgi:predicted SPOUT superfamily RNA methylase MTH1